MQNRILWCLFVAVACRSVSHSLARGLRAHMPPCVCPLYNNAFMQHRASRIWPIGEHLFKSLPYHGHKTVADPMQFEDDMSNTDRATRQDAVHRISAAGKERLRTDRPQVNDPFIRAENEDDDGYDPYSDRRPEREPLFERDPWG